jgi:hypothetical protein
MKQLLLITALAGASGGALQGCVTAHASGHAVVTDATPDNHLHIVVVPPHWGTAVRIAPGNTPTPSTLPSADRHSATLLPALAARLPQDFKLNGVEADAVLLEANAPIPAPTAVRTLVIRPMQAGEAGATAGTWMDLSVSVNDAARGVLWTGSIRMSSGTPGASYDASAVDHAAVPLLEQLRDAKIVDISWRRPVTP